MATKPFIEIDGDIALIPDDRTIVVLVGYDEVQIKQIVFGAEKLRSEDMSSYPALIYSPFAVWADAQSMKAGFNPNNLGVQSRDADARLDAGTDQIGRGVGELESAGFREWQRAFERGLAIDMQLRRRREAIAIAVGGSPDVSQADGNDSRRDGATTISTSYRPISESWRNLKLSVLKQGMQFLDAIEFKVDGATTTARCRFPSAAGHISSLLGPAMTASREAAMRAQSMNNMKQIGAGDVQHVCRR